MRAPDCAKRTPAFKRRSGDVGARYTDFGGKGQMHWFAGQGNRLNIRVTSGR
jgi:hypothetical protein